MASKVMNVTGFKLEPFHKRVEKYGRWFEVRTQKGDFDGDEWIELMGGTLDNSGSHWHQGVNKDMTNRFDRRRGVLKTSTFFANNAITGERLDEDKVGSDLGECTTIFRTESDARTKTVRVAEADIVPTNSVSWSS